ncbi:hypothetical protein HDU90_003225 [Geranomyces variabilis]|nr:hypothetical protein HDU90_003225 [Geranomyces variabilis]
MDAPALVPFLHGLVDLIDGSTSTPAAPCAEAATDCDGVSRDASTLSPLSRILATSDADVERALRVADAFHARGDWARTSLADRQLVLDRIAEELECGAGLVGAAETVDVGVTQELRDMAGSIGKAVFTRDLNRLFADHSLTPRDLCVADDGDSKDNKKLATLQSRPRGPAVIIAPTNGPVISALVQLGMAVQAGNPATIKPLSYSPHSYNVVVDAPVAANIPDDLIQEVHGGKRVGRMLVESPLTQSVCFTGGVSAGLEVASSSNSFIVMADADLDLAAESLIASLTFVNGHYCCGAGRVLVHADVKDAFLDAVGIKMALVKIGLPTDKATQMGPPCVALAKPLLAKVHALLQHPGAKSFTATPIPDNLPAGHFVPPTLILDAPVTSDELFRPVATLQMFTTVDEVVSMTRAGRSRLKGYIYGKDAAAVHAVQERIICAWWDWNVFRVGNPGVKSVGFAGLSGWGDGTPDMFLQSRYIGIPE